jgi:polar amino acid transport system permease protein
VIHDFGIVWLHRGLILSGLVNTDTPIGVSRIVRTDTGRPASTALSRSRTSASIVRILIDTARCTPFLLFAYIIYYGLPSIGVRFDNWSAGAVALIVYHTAYMA